VYQQNINFLMKVIDEGKKNLTPNCYAKLW